MRNDGSTSGNINYSSYEFHTHINNADKSMCEYGIAISAFHYENETNTKP